MKSKKETKRVDDRRRDGGLRNIATLPDLYCEIGENCPFYINNMGYKKKLSHMIFLKINFEFIESNCIQLSFITGVQKVS